MPAKKVIKAVFYFHADKMYLYEEAKKLRLSPKAANYFMYANEIAVILTIDKGTGEVLARRIKPKRRINVSHNRHRSR